jgi:hypothetical protein
MVDRPTNMMPEVLQGTLDPRIAPRGVLRGHAQNQGSDGCVHTWTSASGPCMRIPASRQLAVPTQNRVRCRNGRHLRQRGTSRLVPEQAQTLPFIISKSALPIDHQTEFIEVPDVRARPPRAPQSSGVLRAEPQRPEPNGFMRYLDPSGQHQLGDVTQAHTEAEIEPHAMTDDRWREAITLVERQSGRRLGHDASEQTAYVLTMQVRVAHQHGVAGRRP